MPRTRKKVKSIVKTKVISARVTEVVRELLHQQAEDAGMTLSEFAAQMLMKGRVNISYVFYVHPDEIEAITREFAAIGNNLNQIAAFFNSGGIQSRAMHENINHKEIYKRPEMVHLLKDCKKGAVNLIFSQTRAYLAANTCDFCFLLKYLFDLPMRVDIVTDDDDQRIDTILDVENQRQNLKELAEKYTSIRRKDYLEWRIRLEDEMTKAEEK